MAFEHPRAALPPADSATLLRVRALAATEAGTAYRVQAELTRLDRQLAATRQPGAWPTT